MNILHVAILYRDTTIFYMVVGSKVFARSLLLATDNNGNSLLHMVGQKRKSQASERMQSHASQLRKELQLFEVHFYSPINIDIDIVHMHTLIFSHSIISLLYKKG